MDMPQEKEVEVDVLPLIAVLQSTKGKVRPVFREGNSHVECHMGREVGDICEETLRKWRRVTRVSKMVDLKSAYIQHKESKSLWKYQLVRYKGRTYCLTRLNSSKNYVDDFKEDIGEDGQGRQRR